MVTWELMPSMTILWKLALTGVSDPADLKGLIGADPLGKMASTGIPLAILKTWANWS